MTDEELQECYNNCIEYSNKIKNPILRKSCQEIYEDYKEKLINKPATVGRHHCFKGGLLYHIYCVTRNSYHIAKLYPNLNIDLDLILFGALLHDIGKTNEYNDFSEDENYIARKGNSAQLLGHSYQGAHIVDNYLSKYDIEEEFKNQVLHMIGNHMNEFREGGIFVENKMLEVTIINFADNIDSSMEPAHSSIKNAKQGELYTIANAPRPYYKSLNPYYNIER